MPGSGNRTRRKYRTTKDRVLQARIPQDLDTELRVRAEQLGLSVSTVVRNVLLHTFDLVEGVVSDSAQLARVVQGREKIQQDAVPDSAQPDNDGGIVGWQEAVLNRNGVCEECNAFLSRGERAAIGLPVQPRPVFLCLRCLAGLEPSEAKPTTTDISRTPPAAKQKPAPRRKKTTT